MINLYVARHGQTESNIEHRLLGGGGDSPLTELGISQARKLGNSLKEVSFEATYVSPLKRVQDTFFHAFGELYTPNIDQRLIEIDFGAMHNMTVEEGMAAFPKSAGTMLANPPSYEPPPGGESIDLVMSRVNDFLKEIEELGHKNIFALTHGYVLRVIYACIMGNDLAAIGKVRRYENCEFSHYRYENGVWIMLDEATRIIHF